MSAAKHNLLRERLDPTDVGCYEGLVGKPPGPRPPCPLNQPTSPAAHPKSCIGEPNQILKRSILHGFITQRRKLRVATQADSPVKLEPTDVGCYEVKERLHGATAFPNSAANRKAPIMPGLPLRTHGSAPRSVGESPRPARRGSFGPDGAGRIPSGRQSCQRDRMGNA